MEIEFIEGPRKGTRDHVGLERGLTLIDAGFAIEIKPQPKPAKVSWGLHKTISGVVTIQYRCDACGRLMHFGGLATKTEIDRAVCRHANEQGGVPIAVVRAYHDDAG
jgi:hypothetical protein